MGNRLTDVIRLTMAASDFVFSIGLKSNKETNDFLRCLWARMTATFGKLGWLYSPFKIGNTIFVGKASIEGDIVFDVKLGYKQCGCLSTISFAPSGSFNSLELKRRLKKCVEDALQYKTFIRRVMYQSFLDKNLSFNIHKGRNFILDGNSLSFFVDGFDDVDCKSFFKVQLQQVCNLLSFDTLRYTTVTGSPIEEIREKHNEKISLLDAETEEVYDEWEKNSVYQNLEVTESISNYIDSYLERPYEYEDHFNNFDKSVRFFAQGIRNEELSRLSVGLPEPYTEQAVINYMSALEVITLNDRAPETCSSCGQIKYSIARRVKDLAERALPNGGKFAERYYGYRSGYVHAGNLLSTNNYYNRSIPLMSRHSDYGMLNQVQLLSEVSKEAVKECIVFHEREWFR